MAKTKSCFLYSKVNYPVCIRYDGQELIVPPCAREFLLPDESKVQQNLPKGLRKIVKDEEKE